MELKKISAGILAFATAFAATAAPLADTLSQITAGSALSAFAETCGDFMYDTLYDNTVEITLYTGDDAEVEIPSEIDGKKVTRIGIGAFERTMSLTGVIIPEGVKSIGNNAFGGCTSLISVDIPDSVTSIGDCAFSGSTWYIGCTSLTSVNVSENNKAYCSVDGVLFNKEKTVLVQYPPAKSDTSYVIPDGVTTICDRAFESCATLTDISIPEGLTDLGSNTFGYCTSLTHIDLPDGVTRIGNSVFSRCESLVSVTMTDSVTSIGYNAFYGCTLLKDVQLPVNLTSIDDDAFCWCESLESVIIPDGVTSIAYGAFAWCTSLKSANIPDSVTSVGGHAFYETAIIRNQTAPFKYIDKWLICADREAADEEIKNGTVGIASEAFEYCEYLTDITVPDSVLYMGYEAFHCCGALKTAVIGNGVASIGVSAFSDCRSLESVTIGSGVKRVCVNAFNETPILNNQTGPLKYVDKWLICADSDIETAEIKNDTVGIADNAFYDCRSLESVTVPDGLISVGERAFCYCTSLTGITLPDSVSEVGEAVFYSCSRLAEAVLPKNITALPCSYDTYFGFFAECNSLVSLDLPDSLTSIDERAFYCCTSLESITIPNGVTSIGDNAFYYCYSLTDVYYGGTREQWNSIEIGIVNECLTNANIHFAGEDPYYPTPGDTDDPVPGDTDEPEDPDDPVVHTHDFAAPVYTWANDLMSCTAKADCKGCDFCETETVNATAVTADSTCAKEGGTVYTVTFTKPVFTTQTKTETIAKKAHSYSVAGYTWSSDCKTCTAVRTCTVCKARQEEKAAAVSKVTAATCGAEGKTVYTATFKNSAFSKQTRIVAIKAAGHKYGAVSYTWAKDYKTCTAAKTCSVCKAKLTQTVNTTSKMTAATYFAKGKTVYTAKFTKSGLAGTTAKTVETAKKVLGKVTGVKVSAKTDTTITLKWKKVSGATGYIVEQKSGGKWTTAVTVTKGATVTAKISKLKAGTTYSFRVRAAVKSGTKSAAGANSATVSATTKPSKVTGLKAGAKTATSITLKWAKNTSGTGYTVQQLNGKTWKTIKTVTKNSTVTLKVTGLKAGRQYKFRVCANKGGQSGAYSATLSVYTDPSKVTGLKAGAKTATSITLKWTKNTSGAGYTVQQLNGKTWKTIKTVTKNSTVTLKVTGLKAGKQYKFRVCANRNKQSGAYSATLSVYTNPGKVTGFKVSAKTKTAITLKWDKNTGGTGYEIQMMKNGKWVTIKTVTKNSTVSYKVTGLKAATTYKFRIRACRGKQYGAYSSTLTAVTDKK